MSVEVGQRREPCWRFSHGSQLLLPLFELQGEPGSSRPTTSGASAPGKAMAASGAEVAAEDDSALCVICMDEPSTAGFLHGDS